MSFISKFLTKTAIVFRVDRSGSTPTGQPIEVPVQTGTIKVSFQRKNQSDFDLFNTGEVQVGRFSAVSDVNTLVVPQNLLEIEGIKYRVVAVNKGEFQCKTFFTKYWLELFEHN